MITTPHISGAATPHHPAPAHPADSSLADFLLAGSQDNGDQDFRTIAAALLGSASSTSDQAKTPVKDPTDTKKGVVSTKKVQEVREGKESDPISAAGHFQPPVPPLNTTASLAAPDQTTPKEANSSLALLSLGANLGNSAPSANPTKNKGDEIAANLPGDVASASGLTSRETAFDAAGKEKENDDAGVIKSDLPKARPSASAALHTVSSASEDHSKQKKDAVLQPAPTPTNDASTKRPEGELSQQPAIAKPANHASTPAPDRPPSERLPAPADSLPIVPPLEPASTASANKLDGSMAAEAASQSGPVVQGFIKTPNNTSPSPLAKLKDRFSKDRSDKETVLTPGPSGKSVLDQTNRIVPGPKNSNAGSLKDASAFTLPSHSGAHSKPSPLKTSGDIPASSAAVADLDGPDEMAATSSPLTAKLVQGMSQSEFRVGMQSQEFGSIDIRTSVARHMFSAQISVEHGDMARSLTAELPALYHKLADQHVPVASIVIQGQSLATSSGLARDTQPQAWKPQGHGNSKSVLESVLPVMTEAYDSAGRLNIHI